MNIDDICEFFLAVSLSNAGQVCFALPATGMGWMMLLGDTLPVVLVYVPHCSKDSQGACFVFLLRVNNPA